VYTNISTKKANTNHHFPMQLEQCKQESGKGDHQTHEDRAEAKLLPI
jgi:hypothetical protein